MMGPADGRSADSMKWTVFVVLICEAWTWTYHSSNTTMTWEKARRWCQSRYTNMVSIRNKNESDYLEQAMPTGPPYYWIAITQNNKGFWIWKETSEQIPEDAQTWADNEPSKRTNEKCVELYIKKTSDGGKWNNEQCEKRKRPLCYHDSCRNSTCSDRGECREEIGKHTCDCSPGFIGNRCEYAASCEDLQSPADGKITCTDKYGTFQYQTFCNFSCDDGYEIKGSRSVFCQETGAWSDPPPTCLAVRCADPGIPDNGNLSCSDDFGRSEYKSFCNFSCDDGYEIKGSRSVFCQETGAWSDPPPTCLAVRCADPGIPNNGNLSCSDEFGRFQYKSFCNFSCDDGYEIKGSRSVFCQETGAWSDPPPTCLVKSSLPAVRCADPGIPDNGNLSCSDDFGRFEYKSFCNFSCDDGYEINGTDSVFCQETGGWSEPSPSCSAGEAASGRQVTIVSSVLGTVGLLSSGIPLVYLFNYLRRKKKENSYIIRTDKDPANTFENPTFEDN